MGSGSLRGVSLIERLDAAQRRKPAVGFPLAVVYKYTDDAGGNLAALITYYAFLSLFPLLLLGSTLLGIVLADDPDLQQQVLDSALGQFPVIGDDLATPDRIGGGATGLVVGGLGALYGGLGVAQALQNAMNTAWSIPRNQRPNPFKARLLSLALLGTIGLAVLATTALTAVANGAGSLAEQLGIAFSIAVIAATVALNALVFAMAFRLATARHLSLRDVAPGAITAAVLWQVLQTFGALYVGRISDGGTATGETFGVVLGLMAFLFLASTLMMLCVEINVVRVERLWPRALLTPFTDDVELTAGDEEAYSSQAEAQQAKGFQDIDVSFDKAPEPDGPAEGGRTRPPGER